MKYDAGHAVCVCALQALLRTSGLLLLLLLLVVVLQVVASPRA